MPKLFYDVEDPVRLRASLESLETWVDDRDRRRWLSAGEFSYATIAYSSVSIGGVAWSGPSLPDAANTFATATLLLPSTWANGTVTLSAVIGNNSAASGNLAIVLRGATLTAGAAGASTVMLNAAVTAPSQNRITFAESTTSLSVDANDDLLMFNVERAGGEASDTLAGTAVLLGALATYEPN